MNLLRRRFSSAPTADHAVDLSRILLHTNPTSEQATQLRAIAQEVLTNVQPLRRVAIIPIDQGNASRLLSNIAYALGETREKIALIEADLRAPKMAARFQLKASAGGLADVLEERIPLAAAEFSINPWVTLIPGGEPNGQAAGLLGLPRFSEVIKDVADRNLLTFVQCPPAMVSLDFNFIAPACEGIVIVAQKDKSRMVRVLKLRDQIERLSLPVVFALLENGRF